MSQSTENDSTEQPDLLAAIREGLGFDYTATLASVNGHILRDLLFMLVRKGVLDKNEVTAMLGERERAVHDKLVEYAAARLETEDRTEVVKTSQDHLTLLHEHFDSFRKILDES